MLVLLTTLVIGFSIFSAAILLLAYVFFIEDMPKTPLGILACSCLLAALTGLQFLHLEFLESGVELFSSKVYVFLLLVAPPAFFFFSKEVLQSQSKKSLLQLVHFLPVALSPLLPTNLIIPVALGIGAGYSIWIARVVYGLRKQVSRFKFELFFFSFFALLAVLILILGIFSPYMDSSVFYIAYANFTGISFILIVGALISFPELLGDIADAAQSAYAKSTLKGVDTGQKLRQLSRLMLDDKLFQNENLSLAMVAEAVDLTSHQLSELINSSFGHNFSRYIREQRVAEAKKLLANDRKSSVLAISLMTGFRSQSNFYTAFRELTGESPGDYRKKSL